LLPQLFLIRLFMSCFFVFSYSLLLTCHLRRLLSGPRSFRVLVFFSFPLLYLSLVRVLSYFGNLASGHSFLVKPTMYGRIFALAFR
jgi:hypothetical protein